MVCDDAKLLLLPTFFSGRVLVLFDIENNSSSNTRWLGLEDKKEEKKKSQTKHTEGSNVKAIKKEKT